MTTTNWITLMVGSYAAIVATAALVWNILRERRNVIVKVRYAMSVGAFSEGEMVAIEIINNGNRPINIQEIGFWTSDGNKMINPSNQQDLGWLKDGDGTSYYIPMQEIKEMVQQAKKHGVRIIAAYVRDSTSHYYKGKIKKRAGWFD